MATFIIHPKKTQKLVIHLWFRSFSWSQYRNRIPKGPTVEPLRHISAMKKRLNRLFGTKKLENPLARVWVPLPCGVDRKWQIYTETPQVMAGRKMRIHHWILAPLETNPYLGSSLRFDGAFLTTATLSKLTLVADCSYDPSAVLRLWSCHQSMIRPMSQPTHLPGLLRMLSMWPAPTHS